MSLESNDRKQKKNMDTSIKIRLKERGMGLHIPRNFKTTMNEMYLSHNAFGTQLQHKLTHNESMPFSGAINIDYSI